MAVQNKAKSEKAEEKRKREAAEQLQSDAVSKLYKNKNQIDNSKNTKR